MTDTIIHVGDVGTKFRVIIVDEDLQPVDVSSATVKKIYFKKGNGSKLVKTALFLTDGKNGVIQYIGISGDVDTPGRWQMQGWVEMPDGKYYSAVATFQVNNNIS